MIINNEFREYLDKNIINYGAIIIDDNNEILYNNINIKDKIISDGLKKKLNELKNNNDILDFFNDTSIEYYNFIISSNNILYNLTESKNITSNIIKKFSDISEQLVSSGKVDVNITKFFNKKNNSGMECILPIIVNKKYIGSMIIISNETTLNKKIKESFFRYSIGLLLTTIYFIERK